MGLEDDVVSELVIRTEQVSSTVDNSGGPTGIVLVMDTSFLTGFWHRALWTVFANAKVLSAVHTKKVSYHWFVPPTIIDEYNRFWREKTPDAFGVPRALAPLEDVLRGAQNLGLKVGYVLPNGEELMRNVSRAALLEQAEALQLPGKALRRIRSLPDSDLDVYGSAVFLACFGLDVFVASSDFKDIARPLQAQAEDFRRDGLSITPLPPLPIEKIYFEEERKLVAQPGIKLVAAPLSNTVTGKVIRDLQDAGRSSSSYPVVIFEKGVRSGDAVFNAAVAVATKEYFKPFRLPEGLAGILGEDYKAVPVVTVTSINDERGQKVISRAFRELNALDLVIVDQSEPYLPRLAWEDLTVGGTKQFTTRAGRGITHAPLYRADPDFLYWQANSKFAKATYKPLAQRHSTPSRLAKAHSPQNL